MRDFSVDISHRQQWSLAVWIVDKQLFVFCPLTDVKQIPFQDTQAQGAPVPGTALGSSTDYKQDHSWNTFSLEQSSSLFKWCSRFVIHSPLEREKCPLFMTMTFLITARSSAFRFPSFFGTTTTAESAMRFSFFLMKNIWQYRFPGITKQVTQSSLTQLGQNQGQPLMADCSLQLEGTFGHKSLTTLSLTRTSLQSKVSSFRNINSHARLVQSQLPDSWIQYSAGIGNIAPNDFKKIPNCGIWPKIKSKAVRVLETFFPSVFPFLNS